jgi:hypothetical protein
MEHEVNVFAGNHSVQLEEMTVPFLTQSRRTVHRSLRMQEAIEADPIGINLISTGTFLVLISSEPTYY